jgi:hypothetical protein
VHTTTNISIYKSARNPKPTGVGTIQWALDEIKNGKYADAVNKIRNASSKDERDELKKKINAVTFSGHFKYRDTQLGNLIAYSGFICQDIDKLSEEQLFDLRNQLLSDEYVYAFFVSPSGNGVKILFYTDNLNFEKHKDYWCAVENYINTTYN